MQYRNKVATDQLFSKLYFSYRNWTPVSGALHDPWPFCHFNSRHIHGCHLKEHEKTHQIPKKIDPFKAKENYGVGIWDTFNAKNEKIVCKIATD